MKQEGNFGAESKEGIDFGAESIASPKHPEQNEDTYAARPDIGLFLVGDGMGGHAAGEVASRLAAKTIVSHVEHFASDLGLDEMEVGVKRAIEKAHAALRKEGEENPEREGMATTLSLLKICEEEGKIGVVVANVGDSRVYRFSVQGELQQVTLDDGMLVEYARIEGQDASKAYKLQKEFAEMTNAPDDGMLRILWAGRNRTDGLGASHEVQPRLYSFEDVPKGEVFLICSDGVHDNLRDSQIEQILREHAGEGLEAQAKAIVEAAKEVAMGGKIKNGRAKKDDITAVVVRI